MDIQIARNGDIVGAYPVAAMPGLVASGSVLPTDQYWHEGMNDWAAVGVTWQGVTPQAQAPSGAGKLSVLAIVAVVFGVLALPLAFVVVGAVLGLGAIICGHIALSAAKRDASNMSRNVALVGTVLGYVSFLIAAVIVALQVGILSALLSGNIDAAREARVEADIQSISTQLRVYEMQNEAPPTTQQGLKALVSQPVEGPAPRRWRQLLEDVPLDPWGEEYIFCYPGQRNPMGFDLFSKGPDRQEGGGDDIGNLRY